MAGYLACSPRSRGPGSDALPQIVLVSAIAGALVGLIATWRGTMRFEELLPFGYVSRHRRRCDALFGTPLTHCLDEFGEPRMHSIGLTGGIGSGKTTVADSLRGRAASR